MKINNYVSIEIKSDVARYGLYICAYLAVQIYLEDCYTKKRKYDFRTCNNAKYGD